VKVRRLINTIVICFILSAGVFALVFLLHTSTVPIQAIASGKPVISPEAKIEPVEPQVVEEISIPAHFVVEQQPRPGSGEVGSVVIDVTLSANAISYLEGIIGSVRVNRANGQQVASAEAVVKIGSIACSPRTGRPPVIGYVLWTENASASQQLEDSELVTATLTFDRWDRRFVIPLGTDNVYVAP
jgi:hypothetical protein